ncbi:MAG: hydantoinase/oxoprolinase family protein, partial [Syntrophobacterales bacterium]
GQSKMITHLTDLEEKFSQLKVRCRRFMMQCNGGLIGFPKIKKKPITASSSGPVAGVLAGKFFANSLDLTDVITFDVGGTSTDISIIKDNQISITIESELERHPMQIPMVDFITIGAGGGSVVWIDSGQGLRVGPRSAGADPGPVCYNKGGEDPTTTDAMLRCGIINPEKFLGGKMVLSSDKAGRALEEKISNVLSISSEQAAVSSIQVAIANIAEGIKSVSVGKGLDPRDFVLVAFGGAGPMFGSFVAAELGSPVVLIPPRPGITSAFGILATDIKSDFVVTKICIDEDISPAEISSLFGKLEARALGDLEDEMDGKEILIFRSIDLRYFGQSFELNVPVPRRDLIEEDIRSIRKAFFHKHEQVYGHFFEDKPVQYVKLRVTAVIKKDPPDLSRAPMIDFESGDPLIEKRTVFLPMGKFTTPVYNRRRMRTGYVIEGPCIVEQMDSTTLLLPDDKGKVTENGSLIIERMG